MLCLVGGEAGGVPLNFVWDATATTGNPLRRELEYSSCPATVPTFKHSAESPYSTETEITVRRPRVAGPLADDSRVPPEVRVAPWHNPGGSCSTSYQAREGTSGTKEKT